MSDITPQPEKVQEDIRLDKWQKSTPGHKLKLQKAKDKEKKKIFKEARGENTFHL